MLIRKINFFNIISLVVLSVLGVIFFVFSVITGIIAHPKFLDLWYNSDVIYYILGMYILFVILVSLLSFVNEIKLLIIKKTPYRDFFLNPKILIGWIGAVVLLFTVLIFLLKII